MVQTLPKARLRGLVTVGLSVGLGLVSSAVQGGPRDLVLTFEPVLRACVSSPFGPRVLLNRPLAGTFHQGIDLPAPVGSSVMAVAPGKIIVIHRRGVGGLEVLIQHDGFVGVYSHLGLITPMLAEGRKITIRGGEQIATVGRSGLTYGPHLYFGMIVNGRPIDPAPYLQLAPCGARNGALTSRPD